MGEQSAPPVFPHSADNIVAQMYHRVMGVFLRECLNEKTLYEVLEVSETASVETIVAAYRSLCKRYHPDVYPDKGKATAKTQELNAAFEVLGNAEKRKAYDQSRQTAKNPKPNQAEFRSQPPRAQKDNRGERSTSTLFRTLPTATFVLLVFAIAALKSWESESQKGDSDAKIDRFEIALRNYFRTATSNRPGTIVIAEIHDSFVRLGTPGEPMHLLACLTPQEITELAEKAPLTPQEITELTELVRLTDSANGLCWRNRKTAVLKINEAFKEYAFGPNRNQRVEDGWNNWEIRGLFSSTANVAWQSGVAALVAYAISRIAIMFLRSFWQFALRLMREFALAAKGQPG